MGVECMVNTSRTALKDDIMRLYNPVQILGTPGRILDLADKGVGLSSARRLSWTRCGEKWPRERRRGP